MRSLRDLLIHDIYETDAMCNVLANRMRDIDLDTLPDSTLLDLKNAHIILYLAFENAIIQDQIRRSRDNEN